MIPLPHYSKSIKYLNFRPKFIYHNHEIDITESSRAMHTPNFSANSRKA